MTQKNNSWEQWRWQNSQYTLNKKNFYTFTQSSISKDNFFFESSAFDQDNIQDEDGNKKQCKQKQRNKQNSKNYRQRKKKQQQYNSKKLEQLELENRQLRAEKFCKWCNRPFKNYVLHTVNKDQCWGRTEQKTTNEFNERKLETHLNHERNYEIKEGLQFQELEVINAKDQKQKNIGKIWIAIAVLLLVLGVHMHGIQGGQLYWKGLDKVVLKRGQIQKWHNQFSKMNKKGVQNYSIRQQQGSEKQDYFTVKMLFEQKKYVPGIKSDKKQVYYENQMEFERQQIPLAPRIQFEDSQPRDSQQRSNKPETLSGLDSEQQFRIHKQFIYNFQAQIADIGRYL